MFEGAGNIAGKVHMDEFGRIAREEAIEEGHEVFERLVLQSVFPYVFDIQREELVLSGPDLELGGAEARVFDAEPDAGQAGPQTVPKLCEHGGMNNHGLASQFLVEPDGVGQGVIGDRPGVGKMQGIRKTVVRRQPGHLLPVIEGSALEMQLDVAKSGVVGELKPVGRGCEFGGESDVAAFHSSSLAKSASHSGSLYCMGWGVTTHF